MVEGEKYMEKEGRKERSVVFFRACLDVCVRVKEERKRIVIEIGRAHV